MDNHTDCNCSNKLSSKANQVFRLEYSPVSEEKQAQISASKETLAKLYTSLEDFIPYPPEDMTDTQAMDAYFVASESIYEARRHLQLASYYITHALTAV